ncbi:aminoglycoside adenylyltransferase domain-containing protein [Oceanirhabdus seepicola]|uniref:DUF4111 domain-containing protein n=1 Tax=Oceanirhabdus seepicola TaxID=2828781 RepID=A0A9J6NUS4_9CLOT|nr:aminoglycoside adenylyltransferase domain-containing protein [Oceanirhabdus seepicola]MCM1988231.1 DUF4111 domain-containing protein [Oceanirhabdus seepicola]
MNKQLLKYKDVYTLIELLKREVKDILKDEFIGLYIHGSLALGDFDPKSSDIDFLVVTKDMVSQELFNSLRKMHNGILRKENKWAYKLEGSYVSKDLLHSKIPPTEPRPYVNGREFSLEHYGYEWVLERYTLREYGIIIEGPNPQSFMDSIASSELQQASLKILNQWWAPMLLNPNLLEEREYQVYAILTMCRILNMFKYGNVVSKKNAAEWAQNAFNNRWEVLIEKALRWKNDLPFDNLEETLEIIKFTRSYVNNNLYIS